MQKVSESKRRLSGLGFEQIKRDHGLKNTGSYDIFENKQGDLFIKPKDGSGPGEPVGININNFIK